MGILTSITSGFIKDFLKEKVFTKDNINKILGFRSKKHGYYNQLRLILRGMPFIYKDFDSQVLSDFQDIEIIHRLS